MKKTLKILLLTFVFLISFNLAGAEATDINLTIRSGDTIIFSNTVPLPAAGTIELNSHSLNADSVLSILNSADLLSTDFSISDLQYYDSFGSFYLKCINSSVGNNCDNWQYTVNNSYPGIGMDKKILLGGENVYVYFGPQNKILLSSNNINTNENLTVTTQTYKYLDNSWETRTGVIVGITQPDPSNPWSPIEILTSAVDGQGKAIFSSISTGSYNVGVKDDSYFPTESLTVSAPTSGGSVGGSGGSKEIIIDTQQKEEKETKKEKKEFNTEKALQYLISQQKENGSFGENLYTDWVSIALAAHEKNQNTKLIKYLTSLKTVGSLLTDQERHAMALMSLGLNPYNTNGENYIKKITDSFDGKQFGNKEEDNDDIFALIVLQNAGYAKDEDIIKNTIAFILSRQKENGSWDESIDMTGAAIESLSSFAGENFLLRGVSQADEPRGSAPLASGDSDLGKEEFSPAKIDTALLKAKEFLKQNQKETGGWKNVSSTAWALEGILALNEKNEDWEQKENTPFEYLTENQDEDGGIKDEYESNRIWQTAYVLKALSNKTWNQVMQKFEKPMEQAEKIEKKEEKLISNAQPKSKKIEEEKQEETPVLIEEKIEEVNWLKKIWQKILNIF